MGFPKLSLPGVIGTLCWCLEVLGSRVGWMGLEPTKNQNPAQRTQDGYYHNKGNKSNRGSKRGGYKDRTRRINAIENEDYEDYQEYDNTQQYTQSQNQDQYQQNPQIVSNIQRQGQDHQAFRGTSQIMDVTPKNWRAPLESEENSQRVGVVRYSDKNPYRK